MTNYCAQVSTCKVISTYMQCEIICVGRRWDKMQTWIRFSQMHFWILSWMLISCGLNFIQSITSLKVIAIDVSFINNGQSEPLLHITWPPESKTKENTPKELKIAAAKSQWNQGEKNACSTSSLLTWPNFGRKKHSWSQQEHVAHQLTVHFFFLYLYSLVNPNFNPWSCLKPVFPFVSVFLQMKMHKDFMNSLVLHHGPWSARQIVVYTY